MAKELYCKNPDYNGIPWDLVGGKEIHLPATAQDIRAARDEVCTEKATLMVFQGAKYPKDFWYKAECGQESLVKVFKYCPSCGDRLVFEEGKS